MHKVLKAGLATILRIAARQDSRASRISRRQDGSNPRDSSTAILPEALPHLRLLQPLRWHKDDLLTLFVFDACNVDGRPATISAIILNNHTFMLTTHKSKCTPTVQQKHSAHTHPRACSLHDAIRNTQFARNYYFNND